MNTKKCSKCFAELPITEFHKNGFGTDGSQKYRGYCKKCACSLEMERYWDKREYVDAQKTTCEKCGETRVYVLDFHHRVPSDKDYTIGRMMKGKLEVIQSEIDKCVVLCANCHRAFHYLEKYENTTLDTYLENC